MTLRRTSHAVYDTQYHLVWCPKYRKSILHGQIGRRVAELFAEIAFAYDITIDRLHVGADHVHILCSFPPRYSIVQVVTRLKSLSARAVFREFPQIKSQLWGGALWEGSYFARTVGDQVTSAIIERYIARHEEGDEDGQLGLLFDDP